MRNAEKWGLALPPWQKRSKVDAYWSKWCKRQHAEGANKHVMDASVLLSPSTHVNAVSASSPKVTCVSLGLSSRLRAPSLACRPSEQPCRPQLTVRTASSSDREEARPAAMKRQDGWRQTEGWRSRKVREKKKKKSVRPAEEYHNSECIPYQTARWHHQAGPGSSGREKYAPVSYKADDLSSG